MTAQTEHSSVKRVRTEQRVTVSIRIRHLSDTARTAVDAANVLDVELAGASSIVFKIDTDQGDDPLGCFWSPPG
jgi:hypothetical protein